MPAKKSIVAVDDSRIVLQTLEGILGDSYDFQGFLKGEKALEYIEMFPPELIILDVEMPEMDGYEVLKEIMKKENLSNIPVIFLTSNNEREDVIKAATYGADDYVLKPVNRDVLIGKMEALLNRSSLQE